MFPWMPCDVPDVDVSQSLFSCDSAVFFEGLHGCIWQVHELVVRVESEKVNWHVRSQVVVEPAAKLSGFVEIIANLWNNQVCDLDMRLASILDLLNRLKNWLRVRYPDILSDETGLPTSFEVNCYAVEKVIHHRNRVWSIESVGDKYVDESIPTRLDSDVMGELHEYGRLVVRVRNPLTTMAQRQAYHVRRH